MEKAGRLFAETGTEAPSAPGPASSDMEVDIPPRYKIADHLMMDAATMMPRNIYGYVRNRTFRFPRDTGLVLGKLYKVLFKMIVNGIQYYDFMSES